jgi:hypothetical protein
MNLFRFVGAVNKNASDNHLVFGGTLHGFEWISVILSLTSIHVAFHELHFLLSVVYFVL